MERFWAINPDEARRRLDTDGTLWLVFEGDEPVFSCWTFRGRTPLISAPGGWVTLPADTAALEESMTVSEHRGRGIAPAAWAAVADRIERGADGVRRIVCPIEQSNERSKRAHERAGFEEMPSSSSGDAAPGSG